MAARAEPVPGPGQVRVRVRAVSLNHRDGLTVQGDYNPRQRLPLVPLLGRRGRGGSGGGTV